MHRMDYPAQRRRRLARLLKEEGLDALLISNPVNVTYLTGFSGDSSYLILHRKNTLLVSDFRFTAQIAEECPGLEAVIRPSSQPLLKATAEAVRNLGGRGVGFESGHVSVADLETLRGELPAVEWKGDAQRVEKLRVVKDASEVTQIREAITFAERAFAMFRAMLRPDDCEKDLCDALEAYVRRAGGRGSSFPSIVAVGERAALPHAPPTDRTIGEADLVLVDWGASGAFYKSDLTRVLVTRKNLLFSRPARREKADAKLETIYNIVLEAQQRAIAAVRPGVKGGEVDGAARSVIEKAGYGPNFDHGTGHGIGLQVHEAPPVRHGSEAVLEPGMVVTIEPGIYLPGWGGVRIEDDVLVTPDGAEVLTHVAKDWSAALCEF
jgi:Xaa-Pro aminopeptidase